MSSISSAVLNFKEGGLFFFLLTRHFFAGNCGSHKIALLCHGAMTGEHDMITFDNFTVVSLVERKQRKTKTKKSCQGNRKAVARIEVQHVPFGSTWLSSTGRA